MLRISEELSLPFGKGRPGLRDRKPGRLLPRIRRAAVYRIALVIPPSMQMDSPVT